MSVKVIEKQDRIIFVVETKNTSYIMEAIYSKGCDNKSGYVNNLYWGEKLEHPEELHFVPVYNPASHRANVNRMYDEYPAFGGTYYDNESLKVTFSDGVRDTVIKYCGYELSRNADELTIIMKDCYYPLTVKLYYKIYDGLDLIDRHSEIINEGAPKIILETFDSANWNLPYNDKYRLTYISGGMIEEYGVRKCDIGLNTILLQSKSGKSNTHTYPYFAIDDYYSTEDSGNVWFGTLQWSGNWKIKVGKDTHRLTKITGGISNFDCNIVLESGEHFVTPLFTGGFVKDGFGAASRQFHDYQRKTTLNKFTNNVMPVLYNAWSTFEFNIDQDLLYAQAKRCADIGMELFVIDDGWFGERNSDNGSLGDWYPNKEKFPDGLKPVIDYINSLGMKFGIWIEPEMVSKNSHLYREHPDWVMNYPTREREEQRNQLVLNFAREDVYRFTENWIDKLLSENNIEYLKFDMNRYFSQAGWPEESIDKQKSIWIKYVQNFYRLIEFINKKYPDVLIENCAEGGTRSDMSLAKWCGRINRSDNQDPVDVLQLHEGFTRVNLSKSAGGASHLHHTPGALNGRSPTLKYMAFVGFNGSLSCGLDLRRLSSEQIQEVKEYICFYKQIRKIVQLGDMYVLYSAFDKNGKIVAFQYVNKDKKKSVIFVYPNNVGFKLRVPIIYPKGLNKKTKYRVDTYGNNWNIKGTISGDTLMKAGITEKWIPFKDVVYDAFAILLDAED